MFLLLFRCTLHFQLECLGAHISPMMKEFNGIFARRGCPLFAKALRIGRIMRLEAPLTHVIDAIIERAILLAAVTIMVVSGTKAALPLAPIVLVACHSRHLEIGVVFDPLRNCSCKRSICGKVFALHPGMIDNAIVAEPLARITFQECPDERFGLGFGAEVRRKGYLEH